MNTAHLLRAIGDADPVFVDITPIEDLMRKKKRIVWIRWGSVAACLALIVGCLYAVYPQQRIVYPTENTPPVLDDTPRYMAAHMFDIETPHTYRTLADASEVIVVADVAAVEETEVSLYMSNLVSVKVCEVLKGDVNKGGILFVEDLTSCESGHWLDVPMMQCGNRVLLFLISETVLGHDLPNESAIVYGLTETYPHLGCFFLDEDGKYHEANTYSEDFPFPESSYTFVDYTPKTLEEIKDLIDAK